MMVFFDIKVVEIWYILIIKLKQKFNCYDVYILYKLDLDIFEIIIIWI